MKRDLEREWREANARGEFIAWRNRRIRELVDPHERECASAAIAARIEKAKGKERREWIAFRKETLGH